MVSTKDGLVAEKRPPRKKSWPRRVLRVALGILLVPIVLVVLVVAYLHTSSGQERLRALVEAKLGEKVNGTVKIGKLELALFGDLVLGDVLIQDATGEKAIALDHLKVRPRWGDLGGPAPIPLQTVELTGLHVSIVKDDAGSNNLRGLFKPIELKKGVSIDEVRISDVDVTIRSSDGTTIAISDVALSGRLLAKSATKTYDVDLSSIAANVAIDKPASGLVVGVRDLETGLRANVDEGKGKVELLPLAADVALRVKPRGIDRTIPVRLGGLAVEIGEGGVDADVDKLALGLLTLSAVEVRAPTAEGKLSGVPAGEVVGLRVVATELNGLLGKEVLKTNVDIDAHLGGAAGNPVLKAHIAAGDARIDIDAKVEDALGERPRFDVETTVKNLDTQKLLGAGVAVPPASLDELRIAVEGNGKDPTSIAADVRVDGKGARVRGVTVDTIGASARLADGKVELKELDVRALDQHVALAGSMALGSKEIDVTLRLDGDVDTALARLRAAGVPLSIKVPKGVLTLPKDDLEVRVKGKLDGELNVTAKAKALRALGASIGLDVGAKLRRGDPAKGEKAVKLEGFDAHVRISGVLLSTVLALRGRKPPKDFDAAFDVALDASGTVDDPKVDLTLTGATIRRGEQKDLPRLATRIAAHIEDQRARIDLSAWNKASKEDVILRGKVELPLLLAGEKKGLDPAGKIKVDLELPRRTLMSLASFTPLVPLPPFSSARLLAPVLEKPNGDIALRATFDGTVARPKGTVDLELETRRLTGAASKQKLQLAAHVDPADRGATKAGVKLALSLDDRPQPALVVDAGADFPTSPLLGGAARMRYAASAKIGPIPFEALPAAPQLERVRALGGSIAATVDVKGNRQDVEAHVALDATGVKPGDKGPFDVTARIDVEPDTTKVAVVGKLQGRDLVKIGGDVGVGGKGLLPRVRQGGLDPELRLALEIPDRPLSSLAVLRPSLASIPGSLTGKIDVTGTVKEPLAKGGFGLFGVEMANGTKGGVALQLAVDKERAGASVRLGATNVAPDAPALGTIDVGVPRSAIAAYRAGGSLPVEATVAMRGAPVAGLVPAFAAASVKDAFAGTVDWNMKARVDLDKTDEGTKVEAAAIDGKLLLSNARFRIPGTKRTYERVKLELEAAGERIHLRGLEAHESDRDVKDRWLKIEGEVALEKLRPTAADLRLGASKWLLFGTKAIGLPDAPRGTLDLEATARMELDRAVRVATVDVKKLDVSFPDRFDKAHQPEEVHAGDVFVVDDKNRVGKLPVPPKPPVPKQTDAQPTAAPPAEPSGMDIEIRVAKGARLLQSPMELHPHGTISIKVRPTGREVRGELTIEKGELSLGGRMHPLKRGSLRFDDKAPSGWIDLWFKKELPPWALRNVSKKSGGDAIEIHMFGPISDRRTVLSGAGPGALFDLLSMHNVGRERFHAEPDLPESVAVEFPQHMGLLTLSFLSVNLPHLLFLDRVAAWNDPVDQRRTYGQLDHYEGDRYFADGHGRIRAARRPADVGKSEAEIEALYLFENSPQLLVGIGGAAGSRGGGGPGFVLEWSSER